MKKKLIVSLLLATAYTLFAETTLQVVKVEAPQHVSPGQNAAAHITLKVLELEGKNHLNPGAYWNFHKSKLNGNIQRKQITPWKLVKFKVGDTLKYTVKFIVPEKVQAGEEGSVTFRVRSPEQQKYVKLIGTPRVKFKVKAAEKVQLSVPQTAAEKQPVVCVPFINEAPVIDGKCNEKAWSRAAVIPVNTNSFSGGKSSNSAELKIFTDRKNIYVAMHAADPDAKNLSVRKFPMHDSKVWLNDSMECFFTPDTHLNEYRQFIADLDGQHYDNENGDYHGFNPVWKSASSRTADSWTIEAAIPLDAISKNALDNGTVWRGGFFRYAERAHNNSAWAATMGSHNSVSRHGLLVFGSLAEALDKQSGFIKSVTEKSSDDMRKLASEVKAVCNGAARSDAAQLPEALNKLNDLRKKFTELEFAERFTKSKLPLVIQNAFPYTGIVAPDGKAQNAAVNLEFFPGEVQDIAWNLTNVSDKTITVHAGVFGVAADKFAQNRKSRDFLLQGIKGFPVKMFAPANVAAFDGRCVYDVLAPNPAGVWRIAPRETVQIYLRVQADGSSRTGEGSLILEGTDNGAMTITALPVRFELLGSKPLTAETKPFVFGWDYIPEKFASQRPEMIRNHYKTLREYGFNTTMLVGLRHFPRPKADKQGNLTGNMDFAVLHNHINRIGKEFDHFYWDLAIWEKQVLRKDLFGLDFYTPEYEKAFKAWFSACVDELLKLGVPNSKLLVCPVDECSDKRAETIARWVKECRPATRIILDSARDDMAQVKSIDRYVDVWMPHFRTLHQAAMREFHKYLDNKGRTKLLYYYCSGGNEKLKSPYTDYMLKFYGAFANGFSGIGFWAAGQYYGSPWYRRVYARVSDTALVYPVENDTIPSRRLAAWHRGVQDLWLMRETEKRYKNNAAVLQKLRQAAREALDYPNDTKRTEALRNYCRKLLAAAEK